MLQNREEQFYYFKSEYLSVRIIIKISVKLLMEDFCK